jgi:pimeloyl-ACP methyl ester carboxylesterase
MAADLAALGDHLGLHDVTVIGHDWGAVFGYVYAAASPEKVSALGIVEMALPGMGVMEQAMGQQPGGNFLWHMGFQSVPELPELLIQGKERPYLRWFFEHFAYDPSAITAADLDEYVAAISQVGSLRAGLAVYQEFFASADQVASRAMVPLTIPVRAYGGEACLGGATLASVQAVAPAAEGGIIDRCGHWAARGAAVVLPRSRASARWTSPKRCKPARDTSHPNVHTVSGSSLECLPETAYSSGRE